MRIATSPNPMSQQPPSLRQYRSLLPIGRVIGVLLLLYLIGPVFVYAQGTKEYAAGPMWQAEKRWAQINGSAFLSLLWYIPIVLFHAPLAHFWSALFLALASFLHTPWLAWFGGTTIFPPVPSSTLLRWLMTCPLAGLLAIGMEMVQPQTTWETKRIVTPEEQAQVAAVAVAQEKKKLKAGQSRTTAPATRKKPARTRTAPTDMGPWVTPKADSLWGSVQWQQVPDSDPVKQAALQAAAEQREAKRREDARAHFLTQQRASFTNGTVDSTLVPPAPASVSTPGDDYDWNEGEGSIQE